MKRDKKGKNGNISNLRSEIYVNWLVIFPGCGEVSFVLVP